MDHAIRSYSLFTITYSLNRNGQAARSTRRGCDSCCFRGLRAAKAFRVPRRRAFVSRGLPGTEGWNGAAAFDEGRGDWMAKWRSMDGKFDLQVKTATRHSSGGAARQAPWFVVARSAVNYEAARYRMDQILLGRRRDAAAASSETAICVSRPKSGLRTKIPQNLRPPAADLSGLSLPELPIGTLIYGGGQEI